jgi:hypothetical protein
MTYKPFILLLGTFLGSHRPAVAQTLTPQIVLAQQHIVPTLSILPTVSTALPAFSLLLFHPEKSTPHFSRQFAGAYLGDYSLEHLSPMDEVRTVILTQSSLPLIQVWGGRLQLDAFQSTLHLQNSQFGLAGVGPVRGSLLSGQSYPGGPLSLHLSGLSLSFRFGRDALTGHPAQLRRRLTHMVDAVLN